MSGQSRLRANDAIPERVRGRLGAIANEKLGSRYGGADFETTWWPDGVAHAVDPVPLEGENMPRPSVRVTLRWRSPDVQTLWDEDIPTVEAELEPAWRDAIAIDDNPAPSEDPPDGNARLHEYDVNGHTDDDSLDVEGQFTVVLSMPKSYRHADDTPFETGPKRELVERWNERGVRCKVVRREWVPDTSWSESMTWWTGYVYVGEYDPWIETSRERRKKVEDIGRVERGSDTVPEEWLGFDSYGVGKSRAAMDIGATEARDRTVTLARWVRGYMDRNGIEPSDLYEQ